MVRHLALLIIATTLGCATGPHRESAHVLRVVDGDTIIVATAHDPRLRVRLAVIDCPEAGTPRGDLATQYTRAKVEGQTVTLVTHGREYYGRTLAEVITADGVDLGQALKNAGLAEDYHR